MNDFGPKRPMSEDAPCVSEGIEKAKRGRPKKKPDYDREKEIEAFQAMAVELFGEPYDDRIERFEDAPSIRDVANAMNTMLLRVRKMHVFHGGCRLRCKKLGLSTHLAGFGTELIEVISCCAENSGDLAHFCVKVRCRLDRCCAKAGDSRRYRQELLTGVLDYRLSPTASILASIAFVTAACSCRDLSCSSVSTISRWSASYCSYVILPSASCSLAGWAAVLRVVSFSLVASMASFSIRCFWVTASVLEGASFKSLLTPSVQTALFWWTCLRPPVLWRVL